VDEITMIAHTKMRLGAEPLCDHQFFRNEYALHDAAMRTARAFVYDSFGEIQDELQAGNKLTVVRNQRLRQVATYATHALATQSAWATTPPTQKRFVQVSCSSASGTCTHRRSTSSLTTTPFTEVARILLEAAE
jgi:hypothetical protein